MVAFSAPRTTPKSPEKGVFPLDHFAECRQVARRYLACLEDNDQDSSKCMELSREYLSCRMQRDLMARQDLAELGLTPVPHVNQAEAQPGAQQGQQPQQQQQPAQQQQQ